MKYPSQISLTLPGRRNRGHVAVGVLPTNPIGTVRCRVWRLRHDGNAALSISLGSNDLPQALTNQARVWTFDPAYAIEQQGGSGAFNNEFPFYDENGMLVQFYDDTDPDNTDWCKLVFGGGEDEIDFIGGADKRNLTEIYNAIIGSGALAASLLGFEYDDTGSQNTDTLIFHPFLLINGQVIEDAFLHSAVVEVFEVDGSSALFTVTDPPNWQDSLQAAVNATTTSFIVVNTTGLASGHILAVGDELVEVVNVVSATELQVARGAGGTTAQSHSSAAEIWRSGSDARGVFSAAKTDTTDLIYNRSYTAKVRIRWKAIEYVTTHQFLFRENDV